MIKKSGMSGLKSSTPITGKSTLTLTLPVPHIAQYRIIDQAKRFQVVCCGRRWGKTTLGCGLAYEPGDEPPDSSGIGG